MIGQIVQIVRNGFASTNAKQINVLDVGCGEGSHLADLVKDLNSAGIEALGVGIDISKDGIRIAAREYPGLIWCVADLAQSPFREQQFDVILSIFSPANYSEFARMLHDDGLLIKVVPGRDYLKELRKVFYGETDKQTYSNEKVVEHFRKHFQPLEIRQIQYGKELSSVDLENLVHMTPLSWGTTEENRQKALESGLSFVTIDVTVVVGKKKMTVIE